MNNSNKKEIAWVNSLKGTCILLVVLYHVVLPGYAEMITHLTAGFFPAKLWVAFNNYLSPLRMPAFFFVSGLLAANAIVNRPWKQVFTSRVTNLFYLYFLWGVIQWLMINGVSGEIMGDHLSDNVNAAWAATPLQFIKLMLLAMSSSWYLYALGLFFLFAKLFHKQKGLMLLVAIALNYAAVVKAIPGWGPESLSQYFLFFLFGAFYSSTMMRWSEWHRSNLVPWAILGALTVVHVMMGMHESLFLCVIAILCCIALFRTLNHYFSMRWLNWIGKNTLQIYVLHRIFIEFFGMSAILFAVSHNLFASKAFSLLWAVGFPIAMVALCAGCSVGIWTLLNRGVGKNLFIYPKLLRMKLNVQP
ncbi:acyltransferase family protein [Erwinia sp. MMLR14_017]|uniref:acyltransferase family protein n=1 Tax=Erwinia sp. MMLR14_017 TaxID=3093842 RepID=UPI00298FEC74|nr:acyltransferase family protein [Erwinia sp. MMLR14_017]MDW8846746.1 acyltransferase family protein [Erwinia sp. MMLR14_017]